MNVFICRWDELSGGKGLTRHKISDRWRGRVRLQVECGSHRKLERGAARILTEFCLGCPKLGSTTMIYTHVLKKPGIGVKSPLDWRAQNA